MDITIKHKEIKVSKKVIENRTVVQQETGLIIEEERETTIKTDEPDYIKLYLNAWCVFKDIKGVNLKLLYQILPYMTYAQEQQIIGFTTYIKKKIASELDWAEKSSLNRFNHELKKMCDAGVLKKIDRDTYQVNPELIGRGAWKDINKLRATFNLANGKVTHEYENLISPNQF